MIPLIAPIRIKDRGKQVQNLHFTLFLFKQKLNDPDINKLFLNQGFLAAFKKDTHDQVYDKATAELVNGLQKKFNVPVIAGESGNIGDATALKFNVMMREFGGLQMNIPPDYPFDTADPVNPSPLPAPPPPPPPEPVPEGKAYKVSGKVLDKLNDPVAGQVLIAFDVDLAGAAYYKTVDSLDVIQQKGGMEKLGEGVSEQSGSYEIIFHDKDFREAEAGLADVIVYAVKENKIIGSSTLASRKNYDETEIKNWDIILPESAQGDTEYSRLMKRVVPFMEKSRLSLFQIADSDDQLGFLSSELEQDRLKISLLAEADKLNHEIEGNTQSHELFYGIGRQRIPLDWLVIAVTKIAVLQKAIDDSVKANIISAVQIDISGFLEKIHDKARVNLLKENVDKNAGINKLLGITLKDQAHQSEFLKQYINHDGSPQEFWKKLATIPVFNENPGIIPSLQLSSQLSILTGNHLLLVEELQINRKITEPLKLLDLSKADWKNIIEKTGLPPAVNENEKEDFKEAYINEMQNTLNSSFPTQKIALMVKNKELNHSNENVNAAISAFFEKAPEFDFTSSKVHAFDDKIKEVAPAIKEEVKNHLLSIQRVFQVSPTPETLAKLIKLGLNSAFRIASIPADNFIAAYKDELGEDVAKDIHAKAGFIAARSHQVLLQLYETSHSLMPAAVMNEEQRKKSIDTINKNVPGYEQLFS